MSKQLPEGHPMSAHKDEVGQVMHRWKHHDPKSLHSGRGKGGKEGKVVKSQDQAIAIALSMAGKSKGKTSDHAERLASMGYSENVAQEVSAMLTGNYDFTTCERPNGSRYGTGGKCRKGTEVSDDEKDVMDQLAGMLPKGEKIVDSSGKVHGGHSGEFAHWEPNELKRERDKLEQASRRVDHKTPQGKNILERYEKVNQELKTRASNPKQEEIGKLSGNERIAADVLSDKKFNSDRKRIAEMIRRGVSANSDFISLVADARQKLGGKTTDTIRSLTKKTSQEKLNDLLKREQEARSKGDTETARKLTREHMKLVKELEGPVAPVPSKSKMTSKDPVASVLKSQAELAKFNKQENARVTDLAKAGKIKGVDPGAVQRIQLRRLQDRLDDAVTIKEQERISSAIEALRKKMYG
jgi:hypothetical protein